ncbi:MAG TPA: MFS transporter [Granulicella sp.]|jgi:MFS family permease|nr:MFS transporter [Granulicella sp.]
MPFETPDTVPETTPATAPLESVSGFAPLRVPLFRDRWIASTVSSVGTWMQDTAGTWLMTTLTASPLLIALMQTAASLPVLCLGLLAGATADIFDRRRLLIFWQVWMLASVAILAVLTFLGHVSPWALLAFTFLLNIGSAMNNPAWQAIVPELVPRKLIPDTVSLNAASNNLARAMGPALGGLMVAAFARTSTGAGSVFLLNAISFAGVIGILVRWKRVPLFKSVLPSERIAGSIRSGLRYVRHSPSLQSSLLRAFTFTFFVSAVWSLLAVVARRDLRQGPLGYGILNGSLGLGAVFAATVLGRVRRRFSADKIIAAATLYIAATLLVLAFVRSPATIIPTLVGAGFCWTSTMATLNTSVQLAVPAWVQARALGTYLMTFQGGLALGSILWGFIAEHSTTPTALAAAAAGLVLTLPLVHRFKILQGPVPDHTPYQWKRPAPQLANDSDATIGPVRVSIEYKVPVESYAEFTHAIHELRGVRLRDGAIRWGIYRDATDPEHLNETFIMESWLDYLRSRERATAADAAIRDRVYALHQGDGPPRISHQIYAHEE